MKYPRLRRGIIIKIKMFLEPEKISTFCICCVVHLFDSKRQYHQHQIQRNKHMQHDMVKIRNKPCVTLREKLYRMSKALVIAFQLFRTGAKYGVVFMAEKLQGQPKGKLRQKHPFAHRFPKKIQFHTYVNTARATNSTLLIPMPSTRSVLTKRQLMVQSKNHIQSRQEIILTQSFIKTSFLVETVYLINNGRRIDGCP